MADKKESKAEAPAPAPVTYKGDSIQSKLLWIGILCICLGLVPTAFRKVKTFIFGEKPKSVKLEMCGGLYKPELSIDSIRVSQKIRNDCYSGVMVAPSAPKDKIIWHAPGAVDVCFWRVNRCVAWMHIKDKEIQEAVREGDPDGYGQVQVPDDYTALLFKGDPGDLEVRLSR